MDLLLICVPTGSPREPAFGHADASLDSTMRVAAAAAAALLPGAGGILCAPTRAAREAAAAMARVARIEPALADADMGAWSGRTLAEIAAVDPAAFAAWTADPLAGAPGGEPFAAVMARVAPLIARWGAGRGRIVALTHAMPIRAMLAVAIGLPGAVAMRIDLAPFAHARLSFGTAWRLRAIGNPERAGIVSG